MVCSPRWSRISTCSSLAARPSRVGFVAVVGADPCGDVVLRELRAEKLSDGWVRVMESEPTPVSVALNRDGDRGFVTYVPEHDRAEAVARDVLASTRVRHVHADLSAPPALLDATREAKATLSVDAHDAGPQLASPAVREVEAGIAGSWQAFAGCGTWPTPDGGIRKLVRLLEGDGG